MLVVSNKKGFTRNPLSWQRAVQSIENKGLRFYGTRPPKVGSKEDRHILGIALTELGFSAEMSHWIIFWIMISCYSGRVTRSFAELRKEYTLSVCLDAVGFDQLTVYLRIREMV